jgi:hypothetical protein
VKIPETSKGFGKYKWPANANEDKDHVTVSWTFLLSLYTKAAEDQRTQLYAEMCQKAKQKGKPVPDEPKKGKITSAMPHPVSTLYDLVAQASTSEFMTWVKTNATVHLNAEPY